MANVLIVDDEEPIRSFLVGALETEGYWLEQAGDGLEALQKLRARSYQVVLTDLRMPGLDGMALLEKLRSDYPGVEVIVLTAYGTVESAVQAMKLGAFDYLQKPADSPKQVRALVARALERCRRGPLALEPLRATQSPAMQGVLRALQRVAATDTTVLLLGESGTGKEVAARMLHQASPRSQGPFVAINCAALSDTLLESELFGHEKGSFTGAMTRHRGRLELAQGGTFFLDEIGELKPALQAKLLRVLQEKVFERVGGHEPIACQVRWIAATNRDLADMMKQGTFREDLYHRIAVFPIRLPPLRARREDLAALSHDLLARIGAELGRPGLRLHPSALRALEAREFPGNVRELANALERAAILADDDELRVEHLEAQTAGAAPGAQTIADLEREAIAAMLQRCGGNRRRAAEQLGIGLRTLYDKLKRYGM
jgi:two-component system response regulator FlrC